MAEGGEKGRGNGAGGVYGGGGALRGVGGSGAVEAEDKEAVVA